jgi:hypothetical protein
LAEHAVYLYTNSRSLGGDTEGEGSILASVHITSHQTSSSLTILGYIQTHPIIPDGGEGRFVFTRGDKHHSQTLFLYKKPQNVAKSNPFHILYSLR